MSAITKPNLLGFQHVSSGSNVPHAGAFEPTPAEKTFSRVQHDLALAVDRIALLEKQHLEFQAKLAEPIIWRGEEEDCFAQWEGLLACVRLQGRDWITTVERTKLLPSKIFDSQDAGQEFGPQSATAAKALAELVMRLSAVGGKV